MDAGGCIAKQYEPSILDRQLVVSFASRRKLYAKPERLVEHKTGTVPKLVVTARPDRVWTNGGLKLVIKTRQNFPLAFFAGGKFGETPGLFWREASPDEMRECLLRVHAG